MKANTPTQALSKAQSAFREAFARRCTGAPPPAPQPRELDSLPMAAGVAQKAAAFLARHPWYAGAYSLAADCMTITTLDNILSDREGHDPSTDAYWLELERRAAVLLPHRKTLAGT